MRGRTRGDTGSMPVAMLITMVGVLLSTLLVNTLLQQVTTTNGESARVAALNAAQSGLDVGLAHIRAANDGSTDVVGVLSALPCGTLTGSLASVAGATRSSYSVSIRYYPTDPQNRTAAWLATNTISCLVGAGAFSTPAYAQLTSTGTFKPPSGRTGATRTLGATYTFKTSTLNIPGGLIHEYRTSTTQPDLCWDAGSGSPTAGTAVELETCTTGSVRQTWSYNLNLTVSLVSSKTASQPLGMCLDAGTPHALGKTVYLQPCSTTTLPQQQWSYNDASNWEGTSNGSSLDGYCINAQTPSTADSFLILGNTTNSGCRTSGTKVTFYPEPTVGAGAAGAKAYQLVNFKQFGRCLDVTGQAVSAAFLIDWQCKQAPNPANVTWNQKWALPTIPNGADGVKSILTTTYNAQLYCLQSPRSIAPAQYVRVVACTSSATAGNLMWRLYASADTYAKSYTVVDADGHCLAPTDPNATNPDLYSTGQKISKIVVATCDGSTLQKWNAPTSILQAIPLKDISES